MHDAKSKDELILSISKIKMLRYTLTNLILICLFSFLALSDDINYSWVAWLLSIGSYLCLHPILLAYFQGYTLIINSTGIWVKNSFIDWKDIKSIDLLSNHIAIGDLSLIRILHTSPSNSSFPIFFNKKKYKSLIIPPQVLQENNITIYSMLKKYQKKHALRSST